MNRCEKCDTINSDNAKYCKNCGYEIPKITIVEKIEINTAPKKKRLNKKQIEAIVGAVIGLIIMFSIQYFFFGKKPQSFDKEMLQYASEINKSCPIMIDAETRLDNAIALPKKTFQYNYTLVNCEQGYIDTTDIVTRIEPRIVNTVKSSPEMAYLRERDVIFSYNYSDKNGNYLFKILVTPVEYH